MKQQGNVLFLILIAVALFAALSYAITQSTRGGGDTTDDKDNITASQIVQYSTLIKTAVDRMKIINGCDDTEISAHADFWGHNKYRHTPEVRNKCKIFHPDGGGVSYMDPPDEWLDLAMSVGENYNAWSLNAERITGVGTDTVNSGTDLMIHLCCLPKSTCLKINKNLGVPEYSGDPPREHDHIHTNYEFTGDYSYSGGLNTGSEAKPFEGETIACIEEGNTLGEYTYYHVLIER
ncbi:MAG: hypothetical protein ACPG05_01415 [Bdellovibrionales bacterium]